MSACQSREISRAEVALARELAVALADFAVGEEVSLPPSSDICASLELVLPALLRAEHAEWERESLDGVFVAKAVKTAASGIRLVGTAILISDQTVTPVYAELESAFPVNAALSKFDVRIGEAGGGALGVSGPPCRSRAAAALLVSVASRSPSIVWAYTARSWGRSVD